jgi:hypothetical protein
MTIRGCSFGGCGLQRNPNLQSGRIKYNEQAFRINLPLCPCPNPIAAPEWVRSGTDRHAGAGHPARPLAYANRHEAGDGNTGGDQYSNAAATNCDETGADRHTYSAAHGHRHEGSADCGAVRRAGGFTYRAVWSNRDASCASAARRQRYVSGLSWTILEGSCRLDRVQDKRRPERQPAYDR